jgi:hypothetical protein
VPPITYVSLDDVPALFVGERPPDQDGKTVIIL